MTDTASTANTDGGDNNEGSTADFESQNDLNFEMSEAEEQAFVNETLGITGGKDETVPDNKSEDSADDDKAVSDKADEDGADKSGGSDSDVSHDKGDEGTDDNDKQPEPPQPPAEKKEADKPATELSAPQTDDLWVEVENGDGEKVKLEFDPSNPASFIPDDFTFKDDKQLFQLLDAKNEMAALYKDRATEYESDKEKADQAETAKQQEAATFAGWDAEIEALVDSGALTAPEIKPGDKGYLEDPAVQKIDTIFKYMADTNEKRIADGKPPINSFGTAFNLYSHDEQVKADAEAKKEEVKLTKERGALVGGSSAASGGEKKVAYKAGSYSNIWEVPVE